MTTVLCIAIFIILTLWLFRLQNKQEVDIRIPQEKNYIVRCSGLEALIIAMYATAWIGLNPVISIRLGILEVLCILGIFKCTNKLPFSLPFKLYAVFIIWVCIGIFYSTSLNFGIRMILKYLYPFLFGLLTAKVVREGATFISAGLWGRYIGSIGIVFLFIPGLSSILAPYLWFVAAFITGLITFIIFSFSLADFENNKKKNIWWGILLCLPCLFAVFRTDILGTATAIAVFSLIKYRFKAVPIILGIGILGICAIFYVPTIKNKMFIMPERASIQDVMSGNIDEDNIQTNYRKFMWEDAIEKFYDGHELIGSGTGRVQTFFYTEATDNRRSGQLHNDFLVIRCDNGQIGFWLFLLAYFSILFHCMRLYRNAKNPYTQMCALVAGSSLIGVAVTMFSDNTISYSMVTLSAPWGFYGMALGLKYREDHEFD